MYLTCSAVLLSLLLSLQGGRDVNIPGPAGNPHLSTCPLQAAGLDAGGLEVRGTRSIWPVIMTTLRRERKQMHSTSNRLLPVTQQWYCMLKKFGFVHNAPTKTQPAASVTRKHSLCTRRGRKKKICARLKAWGWRWGVVVFVLKWLQASAGSGTLSQQHWDHWQRAEMPPFQKKSLNAPESRSPIGQRNT